MKRGKTMIYDVPFSSHACCLIQEMHELGIEPKFWTKTKEVCK